LIDDKTGGIRPILRRNYMKNFTSRFPSFTIITATALAGALLCMPLLAEDGAVYKSSPLGNKVRINGSSNIHDWVMDGTLIGGSFTLPAGVEIDSTQAAITGLKGDKLDAHADVSIPVNSMQSGTDGMDSVMQQAMNAKDHPRIQYHLTELALKGPHTAGTPFQFEAKGELSLNGVTNKISMPVTIENAATNKLKISGSVPLKMTDYKVPPPVTVRVFTTVDDVKISFDWLVRRAKAQ
jgi:polyisoprenoid-binding protein YceI